MKNFVNKARGFTETAMLVSGIVMAIAAAFNAFTTEMNKHYKPEVQPQQPTNETIDN